MILTGTGAGEGGEAEAPPLSSISARAHIDPVVKAVTERFKDVISGGGKPIPSGIVGAGVAPDGAQGSPHCADTDGTTFWGLEVPWVCSAHQSSPSRLTMRQLNAPIAHTIALMTHGSNMKPGTRPPPLGGFQ